MVYLCYISVGIPESETPQLRMRGHLYYVWVCSRFQTILLIVKFYLENRLGLLELMYLARRCQRFGQKQLLTL